MEQDRPLSTADLAGTGAGEDMEDRAQRAATEPGSAELTGRPTAPDGATDTTAMPMGTQGGETRELTGTSAAEPPQALLADGETQGFRGRWETSRPASSTSPAGRWSRPTSSSPR